MKYNRYFWKTLNVKYSRENKVNKCTLIYKLIIVQIIDMFVSYLLDESHVLFIFSIGAILILHLNCNNWAPLGVLRINYPMNRGHILGPGTSS